MVFQYSKGKLNIKYTPWQVECNWLNHNSKNIYADGCDDISTLSKSINPSVGRHCFNLVRAVLINLAICALHKPPQNIYYMRTRISNNCRNAKPTGTIIGGALLSPLTSSGHQVLPFKPTLEYIEYSMIPIVKTQ